MKSSGDKPPTARSFSRDIVVIGGSSGALDPMIQLVSALPEGYRGSLFIVSHIGANPSHLPELLSQAGWLRAAHARHGEPVEPGRIYVAPPDRHMITSSCSARPNTIAAFGFSETTGPFRLTRAAAVIPNPPSSSVIRSRIGIAFHAIRVLQERAALCGRMGADAESAGRRQGVAYWHRLAAEAEDQLQILRPFLQPPAVEDSEHAAAKTAEPVK
jgi:hypothetical protein